MAQSRWSEEQDTIREILFIYAMCDFNSECAATLCHAEEADRLTKHLLPMHTVKVVDSSTPLRSAQNDSAHCPLILKSHITLFIYSTIRK